MRGRSGPVAALLGCAALLAATGCSGGGSAKAGPPPDDYGCLSEKQAAAGSITLDYDGTPLDAYVQGDGKVGIVFSHHLGGDLCEWADYFDHFTQHGYRVLAFTMDGADPGAVLKASQELVRRGSRKVVLVGASKGGTASLAAAAAPGSVQVAAVVSLSAPSQYDTTDAMAAAGRLKVPAFFAAKSEDTPYVDNARDLYKADHDAQKTLKVYQGSGHGEELLRNGSGLADMTDFVLHYAPAAG
ncbi:alpha/beta hydrolase family protein [Streptacidiphilus griseoplanus]|uniref:alpha/beta hydrolase family protein n=1 Tax=Peterkaempfera griseoplana TaxID=66896 RepID=UPI0012FEAD2E|nr:alpha/beta hydrolase [Peterkaempfera griseoplana]